jgi:hypothetical protein
MVPGIQHETRIVVADQLGNNVRNFQRLERHHPVRAIQYDIITAVWQLRHNGRILQDSLFLYSLAQFLNTPRVRFFMWEQQFRWQHAEIRKNLTLFHELPLQ